MRVNGEYKCMGCQHDFNRGPWMDEKIRCPRYGCEEIETNPYLLGSGSAEGLTPEDYYAVAFSKAFRRIPVYV